MDATRPMTIALINPNLVVQRNDPLTTGIVYLPIGLAYAAGALRAAGHDLAVIDAFGEQPAQARRVGEFLYLGLSPDAVAARVPPETRAIFIYAINLTNHDAAMAILRAVKQHRPDTPVIILENTQAVTAYALAVVADTFYAQGADYILTGESDHLAPLLVTALRAGDQAALRGLAGVGGADFYNPPRQPLTTAELDQLPFPAWDLFPLQNYWGLKHAHGPLTSARYLPLLTSRGCPYPCGFCVVPATNRQKWRPHSAERVVAEIAHAGERWNVREFHIEDLDPTISDERIRAICQLIVQRGLAVRWKIAAGTKVETIRDEGTIDWMARAGCEYISISPETGSPELLKAMRKPFDLAHAIRLVRRMNQVGIRSQACFVLGYPGETDPDRQLTWDLVRELTRQGVDEIALFIVTPVPGSSIHDQFSGYNSLSELNFTPTWRADYPELRRFRLQLYLAFLGWKLWFHPFKLLRQPVNFLRRRFETKMEMAPYRALVTKWRDLTAQREPSQ